MVDDITRGRYVVGQSSIQTEISKVFMQEIHYLGAGQFQNEQKDNLTASGPFKAHLTWVTYYYFYVSPLTGDQWTLKILDKDTLVYEHGSEKVKWIRSDKKEPYTWADPVPPQRSLYEKMWAMETLKWTGVLILMIVAYVMYNQKNRK